MAESIATGLTGNFTFVGTATPGIKYDSWSLAVGNRVTESTGFGDTWETYEPGINFGSWSATGFMKYSAASTSPKVDAVKTGTATFTVATGCTMTGSAVIQSYVMSSDINGEARIALQGYLAGAPTLVWDET